MKFGRLKCATTILKRGKREDDDGATSPYGEIIKDLGQDDYEYLGGGDE